MSHLKGIIMLEMLKEILNSLSDNNERFELIDHEHFIDRQNGLKYHLYDQYAPIGFKPLKITDNKTGNSVACFLDYKPQEQEVFEEIRIKLHDLIAEKARAKFKEMYNRKLTA